MIESIKRKVINSMKSNVILYHTPNCGMCKTIERMLQLKHIEYSDCQDTNYMLKKGVNHPPALEVDGVILQGTEIRDWLNK